MFYFVKKNRKAGRALGRVLHYRPKNTQNMSQNCFENMKNQTRWAFNEINYTARNWPQFY